MKKILLTVFILTNNLALSQMQEATITRTTGTNSVFPRQFPEMTIRKINDREYWLFESLNTNTIFHRQFPTYIVRKSNYGNNSQRWGVYRTTGTNSVFPVQFPDRYISDLKSYGISEEIKDNNKLVNFKTQNSFDSYKYLPSITKENVNQGYTYSRSLKNDRSRSYNPESAE